MGALAGIMLGLSNGLEQEHREHFETELKKRQTLADLFMRTLADPSSKPELQQDTARRLGALIQTPYNKKLPTEVENLKDWGMVPQKLAPQQPQGPQTMTLSPPTQSAPSAPPAPPDGSQGATPGILQGGANQLPAVNLPPAPPTTLTFPAPTPPTYTGPTMVSGRYTPAEQIAQDTGAQIASQVKGRFDALVATGMPPEQARMVVGGMTSIMKPSPVNVMLADGTQARAVQHFDPTLGTFRYFGTNGDDITDKVVRTVGSASSLQGWPKVDTKAKTIQMAPNEKPWALGDPAMPPEAQARLGAAMLQPTVSHSGSQTTDAEGNTHSSSTTSKSFPVPTPPAGTAPAPSRGAGKSGPNTPAAAGGGKIDYQTNLALRKDAIAGAAKLRPMVTLLDSAEKYYKAGKFDSAGDLALLINAVRSMNPGTVRLPNLEVTLERERGTIADRVQRWYQKNAVNGLLPDQYRNELMGVIQRETETGATSAAQNWEQTMGGKPLPPHLQRFGTPAHPLDDEIMNAITKAKRPN